MEAIVLAGGLGTRLRPFVPDVPKPMAPIAGRPFIEILLDRWIEEGVSRFILSVGYRSEAIMTGLGSSRSGIPLSYAFESVPLGSGGGLLHAAGFLVGRGPVLVLNGDTYLQVSLAELLEAHRAGGADASVVAAGGLVNAGVYLFERGLLDEGRTFAASSSTPFSLERFLEAAVDRGRRVLSFTSAGSFVDIGTAAGYNKAHALLMGRT
jgi:D-glycero-alpha-D-manno-heptose 1-phosphate guanylyltransferase